MAFNLVDSRNNPGCLDKGFDLVGICQVRTSDANTTNAGTPGKIDSIHVQLCGWIPLRF